MISFTLPDLGEGMEEAEVLSWLVAEGGEVALDQPFVEVLTDKATVEIPSPVQGRVVKLHAAAGEIVKVGGRLVDFDPYPPANASENHDSGAPDARARRLVKASPSVRRLALDLGLDITSVAGSGADGRVLPEDIRLAASPSAFTSATDPAAKAVPADEPTSSLRAGTAVPLRGVQRRMAEVMSAAWSIPHLSAMDEFDASELVAFAATLKRGFGDEAGAPVTLLSLMIKAVAQALTHHPMINASLDMAAEQVILHESINVGFAVAAPQGLVVPVIHDANRLALRQLAQEVFRLTTSARAGTLTRDDIRDGTFTITNYGALGRGRFATPLILAPQVAIIGFGQAVDRPWVVDGEIVIRPILPWSFSADHRVIDGQQSGAFQSDVVRRLRTPPLLLLEG